MTVSVYVYVDSSGRDKTRFPTPDEYEVDLLNDPIPDVVGMRITQHTLPTADPITAGRDTVAVTLAGATTVAVLPPRPVDAAAAVVAADLQDAVRAATGDADFLAAADGAKLIVTHPSASFVVAGGTALRVLGFAAGQAAKPVVGGAFAAAGIDGLDMSPPVAYVHVEGWGQHVYGNTVAGDGCLTPIFFGKDVTNGPWCKPRGGRLRSVNRLRVSLRGVNGEPFGSPLNHHIAFELCTDRVSRV